ncbi:putative TRNA-splicing endonuclease [Taphrina deformans PYCC 5710]|uniref:tRNA-splicing endonuclease n=1 Tax=Taphrina deformans (strain PYCC 5710 / ATCC 11124 / CBS 356.35 / IMI 108563 / JCM 9778 / NBRC 8474) TaxID=1097556 RepID=R4X8D8_TAPDE|nr:putative TRNA-splicing endonuclease [Taphrina deformans PYCC 5710]|eukprot:CCG81844.1 putative TRNA-splicing endonuclease [Taphrina deformans PYCC 5710]
MSRGFDKVKLVIDKAHKHGAQKQELQQEALQISLGYLNTLDETTHWFCHKETRYVVLEAMSLFSFPESDALLWLQKSIERALNRCYVCAEKYQMLAKQELRHLTTEIYGHTGDHVDQYFTKIDEWDKQRLLKHFENTRIETQKKGLELSDQSGPGFYSATLCALFECLWSPAMFETSDFMQAFQVIFLGIQAKGKLLRVPKAVLPAMYTFAFSTDRRLRDWSRKCFEKMGYQINAEQFRIAGRQETIKYCMQLRNGKAHIPSFWTGLQTVLRYTDPASVVSELSSADLNIMDFICGEVSSRELNVQAVSGCLSMLLKSMGSNIWPSCPIPAQDFGIKMLNNPKFVDVLAHPEMLTTTATTSEALSEILSWTQPYVLSQFGSSKYRAATHILHTFIGPAVENLPTRSRITCANHAMSIIQALMRDLLKTEDKDSRRAFQIEARKLVDANSAFLDQLCFGSLSSAQDWSSASKTAVDVLMLTIQTDCDLLWMDYVSLSTTEHWGTTAEKYSIPISEIVWDILTKNTTAANIDVLQRFIEIVGRQISLIDTIEIQSKMTAQLKSAIEVFNRGLNGAIHLMNATIRDVGGSWSANQLKLLLSRPQTNEGMIALIFSPNAETFKEALNLLKETHDSAGRIEALRNSFELNFDSTAQGFIHVLNNWSAEGVFKSATRVVKTASNILDILFLAGDGLISAGKNPIRSNFLFRKLWQAFWRMLETTYRLALPWADRFDKSDLIEFMRDVLECSDLLLKYFPEFEKVITGADAVDGSTDGVKTQKQLEADLLNECLKAIKSLTTWLRLNDSELLQSCVNLVTYILSRLAQADIRIAEDTVYTFERVIVNSKKKKNCLDEAQRTEIYIALCQHTDSPESPDDVQVIEKLPGVTARAKQSASIHDQMQLSSVRKAAAPAEKVRLPNVSTKVVSRAPAALPVLKQTMTPAERAEFLRKRSGELPAFLKTNRPIAKNASAGAIRKEESSASESDSGEDLEGLFTSTDKSPIKKKSEKRQTQRLEVNGPQLIRRDPGAERNRIEQNIRARTNPDLTDLHTKILSWDPSHVGDFPPSNDKKDYSKLINSYQTADRYKSAVEPLFLLETWQHIVSSRENIKEKDKFEIKLQTRSAVDKFVDLVATMSSGDWKNNIVTDSDLLMLSTTARFTGQADDDTEYCLAKVQSVFKKKDIVEIGLRTVPKAGMVKHLRPTVQLYVVKLSGLTPIHREYATLKALPYYDLCDEIVLGRPTKGLTSHYSEVEKLMKAYGVNEPQAKAIDAALQNTGFTLIQGPPGTGKTKTILGMVGAFLSAARVQGTAISLPGQRQTAQKVEVKKKKILLCAPSNAAVDEIVLRLKNGISTDKGEHYTPKIVRMGMSDAININVQDVTLDALLDDMLNKADDKMKGSHSNDPSALRNKLNQALKDRDVQRSLLEKARSENKDTQLIENEIKKLNQVKTQLGEQLDELRDKQSQKARAKDIERKRFQTQILADADVICATLSGSGHELMASIAVDFETVIIDEACQTTELSALIPLKYGCTRCVMVGDPNQLPPTVLSTEAVGFAYNESLFVRMQRNSPNSVRLLAIQYRMHSSISKFPSERFYAGNLLNGPEVDIYTKRAWHNSTLFGTYRFFDVRGREEENNRHSSYNVAEASVALTIYQRLKEEFFDIDFDGRIGIVTPYKEQHSRIKRLFQQTFGQSILSAIDFNTVDGFQGQEKDIIIFSCVRANPKRGIGFLSDVRRMNVALTRAKCSVFILGHAEALNTNETWRALVQDARQRNMFTSVDDSTFTDKSRLDKAASGSTREDVANTQLMPIQSPVQEIKNKVNAAQIVPKFDDTRAPPQQRSAIFETFKKPSASPLESLITTKQQPGKTLPAQKMPIEAATDNVEKPGEESTNTGDSSSTTNHNNITNHNHAVDDVVPNTTKPPSIVPKRKAEPSLFIKRKKPAK